MLGEARLAAPLGDHLQRLGIPVQYADEGALIIVVAAITLTSLIVGEFVPKRPALVNPEVMASIIAAVPGANSADSGDASYSGETGFVVTDTGGDGVSLTPVGRFCSCS